MEWIERTEAFIGGRWVSASSEDRAVVLDSTTEKPFGEVALAGAHAVDAAVDAANRALSQWSATPLEERLQLLEAVGTALAQRSDELVDVIVREVGTNVGLCRTLQVGLPTRLFGLAAATARANPLIEVVGSSYIVREPVGVVACITPWNFPLNQIVKKVAFALAAGCTVVVKPSEIAPFDSFVLAEAFEQIGLPGGVFNLVCGSGPTAGEQLATHPGVDMISLTGSTRAGVRVATLAAASMKRLTLELGGKGASVVLHQTGDDLMTRAVEHALERSLHNSGQACGSITRLVVPRDRLGQVEALLTDRLATAFHVGDPFDDATEVGPLVSAAQRDRVLGYIAEGIRSGARLVAGGLDRPAGLDVGFYVRPTVFSDVAPNATIAQEEIFGPVLCVIAADTDAEALAIANGTKYGLSGAVWSDDVDEALAACRQLRVGGLAINGQGGSFETPTGGFKMSGIGREYGKYGYEEFTELKTVHTPGLAVT